ncbi:SRPBCC family protein [Streptomyces sp. NPDC049837]|uniref:SRPBCC family protein n=1 Tax=Streptomyces sp. NPDC049837 TaxID=3155277 RepID=UPI00341F8DEB
MSPPSRRITEKLSGDALSAATGKDWAAWFAVLDAWGAATRTHTEIARHLVEAHGVPGWHAQSITVGYEQERGLREVGQSSGGDWQVSVSRTVNAPPERVTEAFTDPDVRRRWLPEGAFTLRTHRPGKSVTADWEGGGRIALYLTPKGGPKTQIGLGHTKLPDADAVEAYKVFWKERLTELKELLEG